MLTGNPTVNSIYFAKWKPNLNKGQENSIENEEDVDTWKTDMKSGKHFGYLSNKKFLRDFLALLNCHETEGN